MQGEPIYPLLTSSAATHDDEDPHSAEDATGPALQDVAHAALVTLVDELIAQRRSELDELVRVRSLLAGTPQISSG